MPTVCRISYFKASEAYKSGTVSLDGFRTRLRKAGGFIQSYVGYQTEDEWIVFWVNEWVDKGCCDRFSKEADFPQVLSACLPAFASEPTAYHVEFEDAKCALAAPITEFVTFTLKEGKDVAQLESLVWELHKKLAKTPKFHGSSWGCIIGKPNVWHGILGWDTVEAHWDAVRDGPLKVVIDQVKEIADLWLVHAALKAFPA